MNSNRAPKQSFTTFKAKKNLTSLSPPDQPGYRSKMIVPTFIESMPTLNKALALQGNLLIFVILSTISAPPPLLEVVVCARLDRLFRRLIYSYPKMSRRCSEDFRRCPKDVPKISEDGCSAGDSVKCENGRQTVESRRRKADGGIFASNRQVCPLPQLKSPIINYSTKKISENALGLKR